ncbi:MAG: prepilin-type N-terminal cleavage/methylation domain-containing protein [Patescibacteria group bacterium]
MASNTKRAFTLTELLITIALLGMIATIAVPVVSNLQVSGQLDDVTTEIKTALRATRTRSVARVGDATHGVFFTSQSYTLYRIPDGVPTLNEARQIPRAMSISTTIPAADINFSRGIGIPNIAANQTITITHATGGTRIITITPAGLVDAQ